MASRSPVIIQSSPPEIFRTTSSATRRDEIDLLHSSSSPRLPSPKSFVLPIAPRLKSGTQAQQLPADANVDFTPAATVSKLQRLQEGAGQIAEHHDIIQNTREDVENHGITKAFDTREKSQVPKKAATATRKSQIGAMTTVNGASHSTSADDGALLDGSGLIAKAIPFQGMRSSEPLAPRYRIHQQPARIHVDIVQDQDDQTTGSIPADTVTIGCDEPRRAELVTKRKGKGQLKKIAKRTPKSEAIILDSDEPEPEPMDASQCSAGRKTPAAPSTEQRSNKQHDVLPPLETGEKSAYFAPDKPLDQPKPAQSEVKSRDVNVRPIATSIEKALRRRRSWTPPIDTLSETQETDATVESQPFARLIGDFSYVDQGSAVRQHVQSKGDGAKRRRIEIAGPTVPSPKNPIICNVRPVAKPKAPKKKAKTITGFATAAYEQPKQPNVGLDTGCKFFVSRNTLAETQAVTDRGETAVSAKTPKQTKSRVRNSTTDASNGKAKAKTKAKKSQAKSNTEDDHYLLLTPTQALGDLKRQDFLFGTSSQLAIEESPAILGRIQQAIFESEAGVASQDTMSPRSKSYARVPTAPHGTCLSLAQSERELWCVSARDHVGGTLYGGSKNPQTTNVEDDLYDAHIQPLPESLSPQSMPHGDTSIAKTWPKNISDPDLVGQDGATEPPATSKTASVAIESQGKASPPIVIESDDPPSSSPLVIRGLTQLQSVRTSTNGRSSMNVLLSTNQRTALQPLDANTHLSAVGSPSKSPTQLYARTLKTTAVNQPGARDTLHDKSDVAEKRPRGRPRKDGLPASKTSSIKRPRGRPRKTTSTPSTAGSPSCTKPQLLTKGTLSQSEPAADWLNIDEISDAEAIATPSPPRRRASSSPPAVLPLDLATVASTAPKAKVLSKPEQVPADEETRWPTMRETLFPQISAEIRSTPPSNEMSKLTWHEKILLYDPIVIEDLTSWLNERGLRVASRKIAPKPKARGKKLKDVVTEEPEYKISHDELGAWMVQKWCEANSICCLWRNGLRGGVKTRY